MSDVEGEGDRSLDLLPDIHFKWGVDVGTEVGGRSIPLIQY